jgi:hypothetical protein
VTKTNESEDSNSSATTGGNMSDPDASGSDSNSSAVNAGEPAGEWLNKSFFT